MSEIESILKVVASALSVVSLAKKLDCRDLLDAMILALSVALVVEAYRTIDTAITRPKELQLQISILYRW